MEAVSTITTFFFGGVFPRARRELLLLTFDVIIASGAAEPDPLAASCAACVDASRDRLCRCDLVARFGAAFHG